MSESTIGSEPGESRFGADTEFEERESSYTSDVRAGYDDDKPPERAAAETSDDEVASAAADRAAGDDDDDLEDNET